MEIDDNLKKPEFLQVYYLEQRIKILTSKDAKKLYTNCTAAVLRAKSCIMKTATTVQENCEDICLDAKTINETKV